MGRDARRNIGYTCWSGASDGSEPLVYSVVARLLGKSARRRITARSRVPEARSRRLRRLKKPQLVAPGRDKWLATAPSRKPYFSRNEAGMRKMLVKGRLKLLENHSRFVLLVS